MANLRIEGGIGQEVKNPDGSLGVINTAPQIREKVEAMNMKKGEQLFVSINSMGGSVYEGYAIYNFLRTFGDNLYMEGDGIIASISTLIMSAAKKENTSITEVSMWMIHRAAAPVMGNAETMDKQSAILKTIDKTLVEVYSQRTGIAPGEMLDMLSNETWMNGREAFDLGFVGNLTNQIPAEAVATAFNKLYKENEMGLTQFMERFSHKAETTEEEKEKQVKAAAETEEEKEKEVKAAAETEEEKEKEVKAALTEEEEIIEEEELEEEPVTRAEFNALVSKIDGLADAMANGLDNTTKAAAESVEEVKNAVAMIIPTTKEAFKNEILALPSSKAMPMEAKQIEAKTSSDPYAAFKEEMAAIDKEAKAKLRKV